MMRALQPPPYLPTSHTADSQDQRHRMIPLRPLLTLADTANRHITPALLASIPARVKFMIAPWKMPGTQE
jgi:hypothetical protein